MAHFLKPPAQESTDISWEDGNRRTSHRWNFDFVDSFIQLRLLGLADLRERIQKAYTTSRLQPIWEHDRKNSRQWRINFETGKKKLDASQLDEALESANQAVAHADDRNFQLPHAYLARARVLIKMEKYSPAIIDLNRAAAANIDIQTKHDATNLKIGNVRTKLPGATSSKLAAKFTKKLVIGSKQKKEETFEIFVSESLAIKTTAGLPKPTAKDFDYRSLHPAWPEDVTLSNKIMDVSDDVTLDLMPKQMSSTQETEQLEPCFRAAKDIEPGECLMMLEPYVIMLSKESFESYCSQCSLKCPNLIPCTNCALAMYCSEYCRTEAENQYHKLECSYLTTLVQANESVTKMMAMRVVLRLTKQGKELKTLKDDEEFFKKLYTNAPTKSSQDEKSTECTLMPESLSVLPDCFTKMKQEDQDQKIREAVRLLLILQQTSFFEQSGEPFNKDANDMKKLNDIGLFTATLLLKYLCVSRLCSHKIKDTEPLSTPESFLQPSSKEIIGRAFYMQLHTRYLVQSCDPNVMMVNYKHYALVFSTQPIKANDKITFRWAEDNSYWLKEKEDRQKSLEKHFFRTACEPCEKNWPVLKDMTADAKKNANIHTLESTAIKLNLNIIAMYNRLSSSKAVCKKEDMDSLKEYSKTLYQTDIIKAPHIDFALNKMLIEYVLGQENEANFNKKRLEIEDSIYDTVSEDHDTSYTCL